MEKEGGIKRERGGGGVESVKETKGERWRGRET